MSLHIKKETPLDDLLGREWLCTNHLGGFACGTAAGINARKYHGLLVAAMSPPVCRMVLLSRVEESIHIDNRTYPLSASEYPDSVFPHGLDHLVAFDPAPFPRWAFQGDGWTLEKELHLLPDRNAVCLSYTLLGSASFAELQLRPMFALRGMHELMFQWNGSLDVLETMPGHHRIPATTRTPEVFFAHDGAFGIQPLWYLSNIYRREHERGYAGLEDVWSPGLVRWSLAPGRSVHFLCSTDPIDLQEACSAMDRHSVLLGVPGQTHTALDNSAETLLECGRQFVPVNSSDAGARRHVVMTQYPWSPPSVRDAMIALPGLFLASRRFAEAKSVLESAAADLWNGLLPSCYPEDAGAPRYESADASLWFVNAVKQYLKYTGEDPASLGVLVESVGRILEAYQHGTTLGISVDVDGLLTTHAAGTPTTWMDAKVGDWVVTARQGRPVELNALWYNAVCIGSDLMRSLGRISRSEELAMLAMSIKHAFNRRFWNERRGCLFDVVHDFGADDSLRPNQLLAMSLPHPVLANEHQAAVLDVVRNQLLTPVGLRTLAPSEPAYAGRYQGDPVSRDRAYHQGSVYPWLLGPYADALLRVRGANAAARAEIRATLIGCLDHLSGDGMGQLCELFDGDVPRRPGGALADVRSVGEITRVYIEGVLGVAPGASFGPNAVKPAATLRMDLPQ